MMEAKTVRSTKRGLGISQSGSPGRALRVEVVARDGLRKCPCWHVAFADERKDHRYYELVQDTLHPEFDYRYFIVKDASGAVRAVQPFFLLDQDLLVGVGSRSGPLIAAVRRLRPRFMRARTLMMGCAAGEGHLDGDIDLLSAHAELMAASIKDHARSLGARLIVLKEFPA